MMGGINEIAGSTVATILGLCGNLARHLGCEVSEDRRPSGEQKRDLDGVQPRRAFIWAEAPPFPSNLGSDTMSANGCEQEGRDQRDTKDMKKIHPSKGWRYQRPRFSPSPIQDAFIM